MIGAIAGDIIGSVFEWNNVKTTDFPLFEANSRFTDDTVLTVAVADSILNGVDFARKLREYYHFYPRLGYGESFRRWAESDNAGPYNSWGNGSAMRVSPIGYAFATSAEVTRIASFSAAPTHNHPEGIKGAQAVAQAVYMARIGKNKQAIKKYLTKIFNYNLNNSLAEIREDYKFDVSCQGSVPQAIIAFMESQSYEDTIRKAISIGGDSDTIACIAGGIAQAYYREIPAKIIDKVTAILDDRLSNIVFSFMKKFNCLY